MNTPKKRLARLTREESAAYANHWETYMGNVRRDTMRADAYAWRELRGMFPRLRCYQGAKP